jgi:predicted nucleic acid-binding Zn ribbon protein
LTVAAAVVYNGIYASLQTGDESMKEKKGRKIFGIVLAVVMALLMLVFMLLPYILR